MWGDFVEEGVGRGCEESVGEGAWEVVQRRLCEGDTVEGVVWRGVCGEDCEMVMRVC